MFVKNIIYYGINIALEVRYDRTIINQTTGEGKMPTYDYECKNCKKTMEIFQKITDAKLTKCPYCGKEKLHRLIGSGSGIIFQGTGYYCTDFKNSGAKK